MKTKIYKALSVLLTLAMIFSACVCAVSADTTAQDLVVDGKLYPAMGSGSVGGSEGLRMENSVSSNPMRLYTISDFEAANFESVTVPSGARVFVQYFDADGVWKGGSGWKTTAGTYDIGYGGATYFKITYGSWDGSTGDLQVPSTEGFYLTLAEGYTEPEVPEIPDVTEEPNTYYVSADGSDDNAGTSSQAPVTSVTKAVELAKEAGLGVGDTVTIKVMGTEVSMERSYLDGETTKYESLPVYAFDLIVESYALNVKTKINVVNNNIANNEGATTIYKNVTVYKSGQWKGVYVNSANVQFVDGAVLGSGGYLSMAYGNGNDGAGAKAIAGQSVVFNGGAYAISLSNASWSGRTYTEDVNLDINSGNVTVAFNASYNGSHNGSTKYKKNVNIAINNASAIRFATMGGTTFEGAIQVLNSSNIGFDTTYDSPTTSGVIDPTIKAVLADVEAPSYLITNKLGAGVLSFTETAGKYAVDMSKIDTDTFTVVAISEDSGEIVEEEGGFITVPAGEYTVKLQKMPETATYYVKANATEGVGTEDAPFATIADAINAANTAGYTEGDTVYLKLIKTIENVDGTDKEIFIPWGQNALPAHTFRLDIDSVSDKVQIGDGSASVGMGGPVDFKNVKVQFGSGYKFITFNANSGSFASDTTYGGNTAMSNFAVGYYNDNWIINDPVDVDINMGIKYVGLANNYSDITYNKDVNIRYAGGHSSAVFYWASSNGTTYLNKGMNVELVRTGASSTFSRPERVVFGDNGYIQILNHTTNVYTANTEGIAGLDTTKLYIYNNTLGENVISTTKTKGVLDVNYSDAKYYVVAVDAEGNITKAIDGKLTLGAGVYTIKLAKDAEEKTYYVDGVTNGDGSQESPFATIKDAIDAANEAGYIDTDTVTIKVVGASVKLAGTYVDGEKTKDYMLPAYTFTLIVEGQDITVPADPEVEGSVDTVKSPVIELAGDQAVANNEGGKTYYKNVTINRATQWGRYDLSSTNVEFDKDCQFTGICHTLTFGTGNDGGAGKTINNDMDVVINGRAPYAISLSNVNWAKRTYEGDVKLTLNGGGAPGITFNAYYSGTVNGTTTYNGNVILTLNAVDGVKFAQFDGVTFNGDVIVMNNAGLVMADQEGYDLIIDKAYIINNTTSVSALVAPTGEIAGEFLVDLTAFDSNVAKVIVTDAQGNEIEVDSDGYFYLEDAGEYTVAIECIEHDYDHDCDTDCNRCGEVRETEHVYDHVCDTECNVEGCGFTRTVDHVFDHACDTECNTEGCGFTREAPHVFDNGCDTECNTEGCGFTREAQHEFDHDCDTECNTEGCGFTRTTEHVYDHACDTECNVEGCGFTRTTEHVYENACDTECNVEGCGFTRTTEHVYENDCDADCNECGATRTPADHVYDNDCDADCNECGATRTPADHVYDNDCDADCNECGATRTPADHVYDNDCDADCNECGATRTPADHVYDDGCDVDCNECGETRTTEHVYDNDCDADCNECGETRTPADHVYDNACDADCNECGATRTPADHVYDNDCDADCNVCGETRTPADHVYDDGCDVDCNVCGETRTTEHVYDNDCDADCNECGETRTPADHVYDNDCDADCNECGATRTPADHVYDNACDADCNECGATRTPADHVYDNNSDADCNECGATRQLGAQLIEEDGVKYYYYDGVKSTATGLVEFEGKQMYINKGRFLGSSGLVTIGGKKMYINKGYFTGASGLVTISGKKTYINKGYFTGASGLVTISGKKAYINKGYFTGASGIVTLNGKKMYISKGYFLGKSGLVTVGGKKAYINKGYFTGATGIVTINGKKHYINKGYFTGASGKVKVGGKTYTVVKGIVK